MAPPTIALYPWLAADGPTQMATDDWLLDRAAAGQAALRFYTWQPATLTLGYFQPAADVATEPTLAGAAVTRRSSGGGAILHDHDLTYALALPPGSPWQAGEPWPCRMHHLIRDELAVAGIDTRGVACGEERKLGPFLCFQHQTAGDLIIGGQKVLGSAQRRRAGAILQHGSLLLARSPFAPQLPGLRELAGADLDPFTLAEQLASRFAADTGWTVAASDWPADRDVAVAERVAAKYGAASWLHKR